MLTSQTNMADMGNQWEDLRKQARQLENEIDLKLVSFSKLGTSYNASRDYNSDTSPLLSQSSSEHMFSTMAMEIEQLLAKLTDVNDRMSDYTQSISVTAPNAAVLHTLQRHRDILQDYSHEYQKTKTNITAILEREDLLSGGRRDSNSYKNSSGLNRRTELYLKEHDHIRKLAVMNSNGLEQHYSQNKYQPEKEMKLLSLEFKCSERLIDEQISIAMSTKENLQSQKGALGAITQKVNTLANRFPVINSLMTRVNIRKRRDTIILSIVIGVCIVLLLAYAFH